MRFPVKTAWYASRNIVYSKPSLVTTPFSYYSAYFQKMWHLFRAGPCHAVALFCALRFLSSLSRARSICVAVTCSGCILYASHGWRAAPQFILFTLFRQTFKIHLGPRIPAVGISRRARVAPRPTPCLTRYTRARTHGSKGLHYPLTEGKDIGVERRVNSEVHRTRAVRVCRLVPVLYTSTFEAKSCLAYFILIIYFNAWKA